MCEFTLDRMGLGAGGGVSLDDEETGITNLPPRFNPRRKFF